MAPTEYRVRCAGLVIQDDSLLLIKYEDPRLGDHWQTPGGGLEAGESIQTAVAREVKEETGLVVDVGTLAYFKQVSTPNWDFVAHTVILYYWVKAVGGILGENLIMTNEELELTAELRFIHRSEALAAQIIDGELWSRIWDDIDAGVDETVYLGHEVRD